MTDSITIITTSNRVFSTIMKAHLYSAVDVKM